MLSWPGSGRTGQRTACAAKSNCWSIFCARAPAARFYYVGRDMKTSHRGMGISESDWQRFIGHLETTLDTFEVPAAERAEVLGFINSTKADIVE
jgi:hemoglobin